MTDFSDVLYLFVYALTICDTNATLYFSSGKISDELEGVYTLILTCFYVCI